MTGRDGRSWLVPVLAAGTWGGAAAGRWWGLVGLGAMAMAAALSLVAAGRHRSRVGVVVLLMAAGWWSGHSSAQREAAILAYPTPPGRVSAQVRLLEDPREGEHGWSARAVADPPETGRPPSIPMLLTWDRPPSGAAGEWLLVEGRRSSRAGRVRGDPYAGVVRVVSSRQAPRSVAGWWAAGNRVRERALELLRGRGPQRALLAGFLVGDTTEVPPADMEAMRRSGLTHLVAVSGSNVSLFLMLSLVAAGPLAAGPRRRAVAGLAALVLFVIATRWEPSVVRASVMAGLVLGGRLGGWALDTATALGVTIIAVVVLFGEMSTDVGFALSVLATAGVLMGAGLRLRGLPRPIGAALSATVGAQVAVAPILLTVFGEMPLLSPLTNAIAVPVVAAATAVGAVAVALAWEPAIELAAIGSSIVLAVARTGAGWPQISWAGLGIVAAVLAIGRNRRLRPYVAVVAALAVAVVLSAGGVTLVGPAAVVLDVGQGDAILVMSGGGHTVLVDGGPDPARLEEKLLEYGVDRLDLVVLTHVHADHATGLEAVVGRRPVGEIWLPSPPHETPASRRIEQLVLRHGVSRRQAPVGRTVRMGELSIEVLGPFRRYASPNDQSTVLRVSVPGGPRLALTGDVETYAQADLEDLRAEVLKVPHQGAATSDPTWLSEVGASWAIISVGRNDFGHPAPEVVAALERSGARVSRTDREGDVVVPLAGDID